MTEVAERLSETNKWLPCSRSRECVLLLGEIEKQNDNEKEAASKGAEERSCISEGRHISPSLEPASPSLAPSSSLVFGRRARVAPASVQEMDASTEDGELLTGDDSNRSVRMAR